MVSRLYAGVLVIGAASASWAAFGAAAGTAVSVMLLALAIYIQAGKSRRPGLFRLAAAVLGLSGVIGLMAPSIRAVRHVAWGLQCKNNLKQIAQALRNYWDVHGSFPPVCTHDASGRPLHSWRLLIKPFLDGTHTYSRCNLNEAWDSSSNAKVLAHRESIYTCPLDEAAALPESDTTSYVAVVGSRAAWRFGKDESPAGRDLHENAGDTFLVVALANWGIHWAEPKDIRFDDLAALRSLAANGPHICNRGYFHYPTPAVNAVLVHGDMIFMFPWNGTPDVLTGLLPPEPTDAERNREKHDPFDDLYRRELRTNWRHLVGLPVWIVTVGLLFTRLVKSPAEIVRNRN